MWETWKRESSKKLTIHTPHRASYLKGYEELNGWFYHRTMWSYFCSFFNLFSTSKYGKERYCKLVTQQNTKYRRQGKYNLLIIYFSEYISSIIFMFLPHMWFLNKYDLQIYVIIIYVNTLCKYTIYIYPNKWMSTGSPLWFQCQGPCTAYSFWMTEHKE